MKAIIPVRSKETGERVEDAEIEIRRHVTNFQAMIHWRAIVKMERGDSEAEAAQKVYDKFTNNVVVRKYEVGPIPA